MSRDATEVEKIIQARIGASKGVILDVDGNKVTYQEASDLKPEKLPWWAVLHLRAYGVNVDPDAAVEKQP